MEATAIALLAVRMVGFVLILLGAIQATINLLETMDDFDPAHRAYYLKSQFLRPVVFQIVGLLTLASSRPLATWLATGIP